ncbi:tripartite tricarboxylate transporter substrate-binding protein [Gimesia panareensis]|uniref:Tripartite tricarboxylate transporter family receptor n=1 Tax=Gimesia panareensis TaxID=2527978 RepID=A0A517Q1D7_9PLAN|nr:tripartite tricarboxylate transporter substrate-binding protein [Gimesia panareensis]QDT25443.1 Tripartite tricarboxylate transporter family receptor [Gimesia panareensis]QDU48404.1 Tripartite tricarboxylate transporter family receptor [Gimesia panareensis]
MKPLFMVPLVVDSWYLPLHSKDSNSLHWQSCFLKYSLRKPSGTELMNQRAIIEVSVRYKSILLSLLLLLSGCAAESVDDYPDRPITVICPWSVGGATDRTSRQLAVFLEQELKVPVNVINATGGRGVTGHSRGLNARPDGYTLAIITGELNMLHWQDLTSLTWHDSEPIISLVDGAGAVFVKKDSPFQNAQELRDYVKQNPGKLTATGTAAGGIWHLALAGWLDFCGLNADDIKWIPMNGAGPSLQELASGGVDLVCCSLPEAKTLYESGQVRCLGVMADEPLAEFPNVPTFASQGMNWSISGWNGLAVPKGTPAPIVNKISTAVKKIIDGEITVQGKTFPETMRDAGLSTRYRANDEFAVFLESNDETLGKLLTSDAFRQMSSKGTGPLVFPGLLAVAMCVILGCLAVQKKVHALAPDVTKDTVTSQGVVNTVLVLLGIVAYQLFAERLGFVLTAGAILFLLLWKLGTRWWISALITLFLIPGIYSLFAQLLRVPLPRGIFGW